MFLQYFFIQLFSKRLNRKESYFQYECLLLLKNLKYFK